MQADLLFWKDNITLHMIDEGTRFSVLAIVADTHTHTHTHTPTLFVPL